MKVEGRSGPLHRWTNSFAFFAAAIGSAIGLSNIWKFTYVAGANGGGAFVMIYVLALLAIATPALVAEFMIGRLGGRSPVGTIEVLHERYGLGRYWKVYPVLAMIAIFLALSFYCVIAGWTVDYVVIGIMGGFADLTTAESAALFAAMLADPIRMSVYLVIFVAATSAIVALGVKRGLERYLSLMTPGLFALLLLLLGYAVVTTDFSRGVVFLFNPDFSKVTMEVVLMAVGQAFFSLGVGVGVLMTIGAYMKPDINIIRASIIVACADGVVALLAGLAIFPIVLHYGLSPGQGPGLLFETLPIAFAEMPLGYIFGPLFFVLLTLAALTSTITILEAIVACFEDYTNFSRRTVSWALGVGICFVGLGTVLSFNVWRDFHPLGFFRPFADRNFFGILDYMVSNVMMPLGGICVAIIAGWSLSADLVRKELNLPDGPIFALWRLSVRYLAPVSIAVIFYLNLKP